MRAAEIILLLRRDSFPVVAKNGSGDAPATEAVSWRELAVARSLDSARTRAENRVQRFLDAALELMESGDGKEFTVQEVVDRSGQSLRSFYQYFGGKHELLLALFEESIRTTADHLREWVSEEDDAVERAPPVRGRVLPALPSGARRARRRRSGHGRRPSWWSSRSSCSPTIPPRPPRRSCRSSSCSRSCSTRPPRPAPSVPSSTAATSPAWCSRRSCSTPSPPPSRGRDGPSATVEEADRRDLARLLIGGIGRLTGRQPRRSIAPRRGGGRRRRGGRSRRGSARCPARGGRRACRPRRGRRATRRARGRRCRARRTARAAASPAGRWPTARPGGRSRWPRSSCRVPQDGERGGGARPRRPPAASTPSTQRRTWPSGVVSLLHLVGEVALQPLGAVLEDGGDQRVLRREVPVEGVVRQPGARRCRRTLRLGPERGAVAAHDLAAGVEQAPDLGGVVGRAGGQRAAERCVPRRRSVSWKN